MSSEQHCSDTSSTLSTSTTWSLKSLLKKNHNKNQTSSHKLPKSEPLRTISEEQRMAAAEAKAVYFALR
jgi:hypothetical protein